MVQNMRVKIELLSDAIFGSGKSVPGGEDISVLHDEYGFPYIGGSSVKGVLHEEIKNYLLWTEEQNGDDVLKKIFGVAGTKDDRNEMQELQNTQIKVSDFKLPIQVRTAVWNELNIYDEKTKIINREQVLDLFTNIRTFTKIKDGVCEEGSLRNVRCVRSQLIFEGTIFCGEQEEDIVRKGLKYVKWL